MKPNKHKQTTLFSKNDWSIKDADLKQYNESC